MLREAKDVLISRIEGVLPPADINERIAPGTERRVPIELDQVHQSVRFYESNVVSWRELVQSPHGDKAERESQLRDSVDTLAAWRECLNLPVQVVYQIWSAWLQASVLLPEAEYERLAATQKVTPVWLTSQNRPGWWWHLDRFWWSADRSLESADVEALVRQRQQPGFVGETDEQRVIVPLPRDLMQRIEEGLLARRYLMVEQDRLLQELDKAVDAETSLRLSDEHSALSSKLQDALEPVIGAMRTVRDFQIDQDLYDEESRRLSTHASFSPGNFAVNATGVSDPDETGLGMTLAWYLESRLGFDDGEEILKRAQHVSKVTVLEGVSLDDAVHVKEMLIQLGARSEIVETLPMSKGRSDGGRVPLSRAVRHEVWRRDGGACVDCGSRENLEFDHIIPVSKGGSNTARNLELRCETCNRRKGAAI